MADFDIQNIVICDLGKNTVTPQALSVNQNEAGVKKIKAVFMNGGKAWDIPSNFHCNIMMKKSDGFAVDNPAESVSGNTAVFDITPQMTAAAGENYFQIQVVNGTDDVRAFSAILHVKKAVLTDNDIISEEEKETINQLINRTETAAAAAENAAEGAETIVNRWQNIPAGDFDKFYVRAGLKAGTTAGGWATAEGQNTTAQATWSHAEGFETSALGTGAHAEGADTSAIGNTSHAEGSDRSSAGAISDPITIDDTVIPGLETPIVVKGPVAYSRNAHAEGFQTLAYGAHSHAEGQRTVAAGNYSHAAGNKTYALGNASTAVGTTTVASGGGGFAEGVSTQAIGMYSHAQGGYTVAKDYYAFASGAYTIANLSQLAAGKYNKETSAPTSTGSTNGSLLVIGNGTKEDSRSNAFRVETSGAVYGSGAYNSSGADYAEMFEWADGNSQAVDRRGLFVTLEGEKIRLANPEDDYILGVVSACPSVLGDSFFGDVWHNKYQRDIFGALLTETVEVPEQVNDLGDMIPAHTEVHYIENPEYNPELQYVPRTERPEWAAVGMLGKLVVVDDGTCQINGFCRAGQNGVATASEDGYRVISRLDENHVNVIFR